jgi:hypothetical protein
MIQHSAYLTGIEPSLGPSQQIALSRGRGTARTTSPTCSAWRLLPRNLLISLLTSLSLTAVRRLRFAEMETATPFETGRFAWSPNTLNLKTETGYKPARAA